MRALVVVAQHCRTQPDVPGAAGATSPGGGSQLLRWWSQAALAALQGGGEEAALLVQTALSARRRQVLLAAAGLLRGAWVAVQQQQQPQEEEGLRRGCLAAAEQVLSDAGLAHELQALLKGAAAGCGRLLGHVALVAQALQLHRAADLPAEPCSAERRAGRLQRWAAQPPGLEPQLQRAALAVCRRLPEVRAVLRPPCPHSARSRAAPEPAHAARASPVR
jgi:hypothetical protein